MGFLYARFHYILTFYQFPPTSQFPPTLPRSHHANITATMTDMDTKFRGTAAVETCSSHISSVHSRSNESIDSHSSKRLKPGVDRSVLVSNSAVDVTRSTVYEVIDLILLGMALRHSYNRYYQLVESLCRYKHSEQSRLASVIYEKLQHHFDTVVKPSTIGALEVSDVSGSILLYLASFETWEQKLKLMCKLFLYLDRSYLLPHHSKSQILEYGVGLFIDYFLQEQYGEQLLKKHNQLICKCRQNENSEDRELAEKLSKLLLVLNTNNQLKLHLQLISQIVTHYNQLKLNWQNPEEYLSIALRKMSDEMTFWKECGYPNNFLRELLMKLKWSLIFMEFQSMIEQVLPFILNSQRELQTLFKFCQSTMDDYQFESMQLFIHSWGQYLQRIFDTTIADLRVQYQSGKGNILDSIVELYLKYKSIADTKFSKEEKFEFEFRNAFIKALNQKTNNTFIIMLLSKYCDQYFKNKKPELSFTEFKERVVIIFKSIQNKDLFIIPYKKDLSKRLLLNRGVNENQEVELANLFLNTIGENDESISLQHMFNDLKISRNQYDNLTTSSLIEFTPFILEKRYWPDIPKIDPNADNELILSPILQECVKQFMTQFHELDSKNCSKVLDWTNYGLHQLVIAVTFDRGVKELIVNLYQAIIILLFEHQERYTIDEFVARSQMDERFIKRIINSLMRCKLVIQHEDKYEFNYGLQDKSTKIKVPFAKDISKEAKTIEKLQTIELVERNRQEEFRSTLTKIMKEHRLMTMTELLNTAIKQLQTKGPVTVQDLKQTIEFLIDGEYLKREDNHSLRYVP